MSKAPDLSDFTKEEIRQTLDEVRHPFSIAVFGSENYFNGAAIVRSAHTFLVKEIIFVDVPAIYERATMGTHKWENIRHLTLDEFLSTETRPLVCFERRPDLDSQNLLTYTFPENPILCFGSEKTGIPDAVIGKAHSVVSIPQWGILNDMNLACAAGIAMYAWIDKHYNKKDK